MTDVSLPEVASLQQRARFYTDDNGRPMVEISAIGSKDTIKKKVGPEEMARFKPDWDAFCDGKPLTRRPGTPLTDVPGIDQNKADNYIARNIHNAEELAVLTDGACQGVGHGTLTDRKAAQGLLTMRKLQQTTEQRDRVSKAAADIRIAPAEQPANEQIAELGKKIDGVLDGINALVAALSPKKPGRKKEQSDAAG